MIATSSPASFFPWVRMVSASRSACVGCSWAPSPAFTMLVRARAATKCGAPDAACRSTMASACIASMFRIVSRSVSPLVTLDCAGLTFTTSAPSRFPASSNDVRVRVDDSKNRLMIVRPLSADPFMLSPARILVSTPSAASSSSTTSSVESSSIPSRWRCVHMRAGAN